VFYFGFLIEIPSSETIVTRMEDLENDYPPMIMDNDEFIGKWQSFISL
jgi:hypothetical protein